MKSKLGMPLLLDVIVCFIYTKSIRGIFWKITEAWGRENASV